MHTWFLICTSLVFCSSKVMARENLSHENFDPCFPDQPVVDLYLPVWASQPSFKSKPAFIWAEEGGARSSITYGQLDLSVRFIASQLLIPLQRGDTVLILCSPGLLLVQTLFACQRAGLFSVPVIPPDGGPSPTSVHKSLDHLTRAILQTKPKAVLAHQSQIMGIRRCLLSSSNNRLLSQLQDLRWLSVDGFKCGDDDDACGESFTYSGCKPDEVYLIQYTSGATGIAKPVLVTAGAAAHNARMARKAYDLQPSSVIVSWLPQYHDCGLMFLLLTIVSGATSVLTSPAAFVKRPRCWLELISEFKGTCTPVPSFALPLVVRRGSMGGGTLPLKLGSLRNLILINEPIYRDQVEEFIKEFSQVGLCQSSISPSYGLAENCTFVSTSWRDTGNGHSGSFPNIPSYKKLLPSARLASRRGEEDCDGDEEMEIVIVNENTGELVEDGVEGEMWISSPSNALGYLGYPSLTCEVFFSRLKGKVSHNFVRTGDRGIVLGEERYLFVMGRVSDMIRTADGLESHPHYLETAAYNSYPNHLRGGCVVALEFSTTIAIVAELQRVEVGTDVYRSVCEGIKEAILKHEGIGVGLVVLVRSGNIPKTTSGKLQRWVVKEKLMRCEMTVVSETWFVESGIRLSRPLLHEVGEKRGDMGSFNDDHHHRHHHYRLPLHSQL